MKPAAALIIVAIASPAQWINYRGPGVLLNQAGEPDLSAPSPKLADGSPDISGTWVAVRTGRLDVSQFLPQGFQIPYKPAIKALAEERQQNPGYGDPASHCMPKSIPYGMLTRPFQILQRPDVTAILYEEFCHYRLIFSDGRKHPAYMDPAWYGYSVGVRDGEDFVVDTRGFNDKSWLDVVGKPHSESMRTTERFKRRDYGHMDVTITIDDPEVYERPWSFTIPLLLSPGNNPLEDICENERDAVHFVK